MLRTQYDDESDALYLRVGDGLVTRTDEIGPGTMVDIDAQGNVVGIEVLTPNRDWPRSEILNRYRFAPDDVKILGALEPWRWSPVSNRRAHAIA